MPLLHWLPVQPLPNLSLTILLIFVRITVHCGAALTVKLIVNRMVDMQSRATRNNLVGTHWIVIVDTRQSNFFRILDPVQNYFLFFALQIPLPAVPIAFVMPRSLNWSRMSAEACRIFPKRSRRCKNTTTSRNGHGSTIKHLTYFIILGFPTDHFSDSKNHLNDFFFRILFCSIKRPRLYFLFTALFYYLRIVIFKNPFSFFSYSFSFRTL